MTSQNIVKEIAKVVAVDGAYVWVEAIAKSGCSSCEVNTSCGTGLLSKALGRRNFQLRLKTPVEVNVGDEVLVSIPQKGLMIASILMYLLPILTLFLFAVVGQVFEADEGTVIVAGFAGLLLGFFVSRLGARKLENAAITRITILSKINSNMVLQID